MPLSRRHFLKTTSAAVAATGIEGILAAGRAPAHVQGMRAEEPSRGRRAS
jgi:hypothetical protein